ncbi:hypothetical protein [Bacillus cereus]|nr:hypothetical protein [Bacillus cereus]
MGNENITRTIHQWKEQANQTKKKKKKREVEYAGYRGMNGDPRTML